jgi:hypothetical protein
MIKKIYKKFIMWFMGTSLYDWLLIKVIPYIRFSTYYTRLKGADYNAGYRVLQPGHFILCLDEQKLTSLLIPGFMSHAGFCIAKKDELWKPYEVAEMTRHGYTKSDFFDLCKESSRVLICTCVDWTSEDIASMIQLAPSFEQSKYDTKFTLGVEALYCSELIYQLDQRAGQKLRVDLSDLAGLGQPYLSPDGLLLGKNTKVLCDSDYRLTGLMGTEIEEACKYLGYI